jgi:uncharacterized protein (DUF1499 family)
LPFGPGFATQRGMRRFIYDEPVTGFAVWSRRIALMALVVAGYAFVLVRGGAQDVRGLVTAGAAVALASLAGLAALVALVRIWQHGLKGVALATQALVLVGLLMALPSFYVLRALTLPLLNDVTTDIDNPPEFSRSRAALAAREGRVPPSVDASIRERQRLGYPAIVPVLLDQPADEAFDLARKAALALGWQVIEATPPGGRTGAGRIEATQRTTILRFTDDITIRIRPRAEGTRIDLRSASRIGSHDLGANARRIQRFADEIQLQANSR